MADRIVSVLTYKSVETILKVGGSQSWALDPERARGCKYAVVCRNAQTRMPEGPEAHKSAFMVGKISDVVPSTENDGRWLILFSEYALCDWADAWDGRNPVAYWTTTDYEEDFGSLTFIPMPRRDASVVKTGSEYVVKLKLPPLLEDHVNKRVEQGHFVDAGEFIRHLVRRDLGVSAGDIA